MPQAAASGGWWSYIDVKRPGTACRVIRDRGLQLGRRCGGSTQTDRFFVYLLRGFDYSVVERTTREPWPGNWWSLGGAEAIEVGQVTVSVSDANLGRATAALTVPELPPATYHLMLCDKACTEPLADVIPAKRFTVVADPATARMAQRVDRLERRSRNQADQLAAARADTDRALVAARNARSEVGQLEASVSSLANEGRRSPLAAPWVYAGGWSP